MSLFLLHDINNDQIILFIMAYNKHYQKKSYKQEERNKNEKKTKKTILSVIIQELRAEPRDDLDLMEQFTMAGFIAVSGWALAYVLGFSFLTYFFSTKIAEFLSCDSWIAFLIYYCVIWLLCFWYMCLKPKINGDG